MEEILEDNIEAAYNTRCNNEITDDERRKYLFGEFEVVSGAIEVKSLETNKKANIFRMINVSSSLTILLLAGLIIGLEAASDCINIPVITFSSIIFFIQGAHEYIKWGPQGIIYKQNTIRLRRVRRQIRNVMLQFHTFTTEWLLAIIGQYWVEFEDIDVGIYQLTTPGQLKYNTGGNIDIETGPDPVNAQSFHNAVINSPLPPNPIYVSGPPKQKLTSNSAPSLQSPTFSEDRLNTVYGSSNRDPHFHIHINEQKNNKDGRNKEEDEEEYDEKNKNNNKGRNKEEEDDEKNNMAEKIKNNIAKTPTKIPTEKVNNSNNNNNNDPYLQIEIDSESGSDNSPINLEDIENN